MNSSSRSYARLPFVRFPFLSETRSREQREVSFGIFLQLCFFLLCFLRFEASCWTGSNDVRLRSIPNSSQLLESTTPTQSSRNPPPSSHLLSATSFSCDAFAHVTQAPCLEFKSEIKTKHEFLDSLMRNAAGDPIDCLYVLYSIALRVAEATADVPSDITQRFLRNLSNLQNEVSTKSGTDDAKGGPLAPYRYYDI